MTIQVPAEFYLACTEQLHARRTLWCYNQHHDAVRQEIVPADHEFVGNLQRNTMLKAVDAAP